MNCLITKQGKIYNCQATEHEIICRKELKQTLTKFLCENNGVRIKISGEIMAIEHYSDLTKIQKLIVNRLLKNNLIYEIITAFGNKQSFRPIRTYQGLVKVLNEV